MPRRRAGITAEEARKRIERKRPPTRYQVNEAEQTFRVASKLNRAEVEFIGTNMRIPLTTGLVSDLRKVAEKVNKITGAKGGTKRRSIEFDMWVKREDDHLLLELKNLPKRENPSTLSRYYRQSAVILSLIKDNPHLLGTAYTRSVPLEGVGNPRYTVPVEKWQNGKRIGYVLVVDRNPTEKEWRLIEKIRDKTGIHIPIIRDVEIIPFLQHLGEGKEKGVFAGREQRIVLHNYEPKGPIDKYLGKSKSKRD
ncbi:MAG: hypothetical protein J7K68_00550 [Candidatus Diapherotrites archaeon]|nr:hypothetical protein [Candidatus Diapherotrites archaeon]